MGERPLPMKSRYEMKDFYRLLMLRRGSTPWIPSSRPRIWVPPVEVFWYFSMRRHYMFQKSKKLGTRHVFCENIPIICHTCPKHTQHMFTLCLKHVLNITEKCPKPVQNMPKA